MAEFKYSGDLPEKLDALPNQVRKAMYAACAYNAPKAETFMKQNAKWRDRTGNARNGLRATAQAPGGGKHSNTMALILYSSVPYQPFLEVRFSGRYAILKPSVEKFGPEVMRLVSRLAFTEGPG